MLKFIWSYLKGEIKKEAIERLCSKGDTVTQAHIELVKVQHADTNTYIYARYWEEGKLTYQQKFNLEEI